MAEMVRTFWRLTGSMAFIIGATAPFTGMAYDEAVWMMVGGFWMRWEFRVRAPEGEAEAGE